ncbi:MAG TPA: ABC transporter ATP-binding protein, partial [Microbacterium sp.]|nr:ABC transporter ATP-binding protein [Microbacterium sp.]
GGSGSLLHFPRRADHAVEIAHEKLRTVGLDHKARALAGDISHGDKRKLEIAVILATKADIVLLDEPMA